MESFCSRIGSALTLGRSNSLFLTRFVAGASCLNSIWLTTSHTGNYSFLLPSGTTHIVSCLFVLSSIRYFYAFASRHYPRRRWNVRSFLRLSVCPVRYGYRDILWTTWPISTKLTRKSICWLLLMTCLDSVGQRSKVKVTAGLSTWWQRHSRRRWGVEVHVLVAVYRLSWSCARFSVHAKYSVSYRIVLCSSRDCTVPTRKRNVVVNKL